jgi:O-antigen ligase
MGLAVVSWLLGDYAVVGFYVTGWSWMAALASSLVVIGSRLDLVVFPLRYWTPWIVLVLTYSFLWGNHPAALQTCAQILTPIFVGIAASTLRPVPRVFDSVFVWLDRMAFVLWGMLLIKVPAILMGLLPAHGTMSAHTMTAVLLASVYAANYACGSFRHLYYYFGMLAIPVIALVRGPLAAGAAIMPLVLAPLSIVRRGVFLAVVAAGALAVFHSERMQKIMFHSGRGTVEDVRWSNPNFATSGRAVMWHLLWDGVREEPWFGHGMNASRSLLLGTGLSLYLPHNDWLKLLYDLGILGAACYLATLGVQTVALLRMARRLSGVVRGLAYGTATAFVPYAMLMVTDNIMLYVQYYVNLHFALIGLVYALSRRIPAPQPLLDEPHAQPADARIERGHPPVQPGRNDPASA